MKGLSIHLDRRNDKILKLIIGENERERWTLRFLLRQLTGWWYHLWWQAGKQRRELWVRGERLNLVSNINVGCTSSWLYVYEIPERDLVKMQIWCHLIYGVGMAKKVSSQISILKYCSIFLECWVGGKKKVFEAKLFHSGKKNVLID